MKKKPWLYEAMPLLFSSPTQLVLERQRQSVWSIRVLAFLLLAIWSLFSLPLVTLGQQSQQSARTAPLPTNPTPTGEPFRDTRALNAVPGALDAFGGSTAVSQVQGWLVVWIAWRPKDSSKTVPMSWEATGTEWRMNMTAKDGTISMVTGRGAPAWISVTGMGTKVPSHVMRARFVPALAGLVLWNELPNPSYSMLYVSEMTLDIHQRSALNSDPTQRFTVVRTGVFSKDPADRVTLQTWYFDQTSGLPLRVEFRMPSDKRPELSASGAYNLGQYKSVSGLMFPFQISRYMGDRPIDAYSIQSVTTNATIASADFDSPAIVQ